MTHRLAVYVYSNDPVLEAGTAALLRGRPEVEVVPESELDRAVVAVVAADEIDEDTVRVARAIQRNGCPRIVLVVTRLDETGVLAGIEAGACAFLRRAEAVPERLAQTVVAAANGDGAVPADLLGKLLVHLAQLQTQVLVPRGLTLLGFSERELDVLRLVADGHETAEIARLLCYSERTVKGIIHDVTRRLQLKNRAQAVAYAVRQGLI